MFNIGPGELIVILILALVLLGPDKLPEVARSVGKGMRELRRATEDIRTTVEEELYRADLEKPAAPSPPPIATVQRLSPTGSQALPDSSPNAEAPPPPSADPLGVHPAEPPPSAKG
jgi:sec-independent protein translocase protein TatB